MLHVEINYSFEKKRDYFIVDYIKLSPVYQVKCKLVCTLVTLQDVAEWQVVNNSI